LPGFNESASAPQAEARQLEGIGPVLGQRLREAKAGSLSALVDLGPARLEQLCGGAGMRLLAAARGLLSARLVLSAEVAAAPPHGR
tara:strand:+ start:1223 stop:1480 length:258 start_codon:yes stop_codon:yes gene_type:complete